jgi:hypothetical protein
VGQRVWRDGARQANAGYTLAAIGVAAVTHAGNVGPPQKKMKLTKKEKETLTFGPFIVIFRNILFYCSFLRYLICTPSIEACIHVFNALYYRVYSLQFTRSRYALRIATSDILAHVQT